MPNCPVPNCPVLNCPVPNCPTIPVTPWTSFLTPWDTPDLPLDPLTPWDPYPPPWSPGTLLTSPMNPQASPLLPGPHLKSPLTQWDPLDVPLDPGQLTTRNVAWGIADFCIVYPWSCIIVTLSNAMTCNHDCHRHYHHYQLSSLSSPSSCYRRSRWLVSDDFFPPVFNFVISDHYTGWKVSGNPI